MFLCGFFKVGSWCIRPLRRGQVDPSALSLAREFKGYVVYILHFGILGFLLNLKTYLWFIVICYVNLWLWFHSLWIYNLCCSGWYNIWVQCCYYGHGFFSVFFDYRNLICGNVLVRGLVIDVRKTGVHVGDNKSQSWKCVCMWFLCEALINMLSA